MQVFSGRGLLGTVAHHLQMGFPLPWLIWWDTQQISKCKLVSCVCWLLKTSKLSVTIAISPIDPTFNQAMFVKKATVNRGLTLYVDIHT